MAVGGNDDTPIDETPTRRLQGRRRLDSVFTSPTSTIFISDAQYNAKGSPSSTTEAGVISITVTSTDGDEVLWSWASADSSIQWQLSSATTFSMRVGGLAAFVCGPVAYQAAISLTSSSHHHQVFRV